MVRGKSIRIFLSDGDVTGIRHAEVVNWTGQAIYCPRNLVRELSSWSESQKPGVYFLIGEDENTMGAKVYIGEAENVYLRLLNHLTTKEYWNEVVFFTNKDENLTKGHIKYLESRLIELAYTVKRYVVVNTVNPQLSSLPRGDRDSMEEFIDNIRLLLGTLGHKLLEPLLILPKAQIDEIKYDEKTVVDKQHKTFATDTKLFLKIGKLTASGFLTNEGLVVLANSHASFQDRDSLAHFWQDLKAKLISKNILVSRGSYYEFTENYLFKSPTAAGSIISGYSINGRECWKDKSGKTINQLEQISTS